MGKPKTIRRISDLTPDPANANRGTERGVGLLERSLRQFGAGRSILVDRNGVVIAGNKTLEQAAAIGLNELLVVQSDGKKLVAVQRMDLDMAKDDRARRLAIADNRIAEVDLSWAPEQLAALDIDLKEFWSDAELKKLMADVEGFNDVEVPEPQVDAADARRKKWKVKRGQTWIIGRHFLMCGDSTTTDDVRKVCGKERLDFLFTSPPYNVGVKYESYDDATAPWEEYKVFLERALKSWLAYLPKGRAIGWNIGTSPKTNHVRQHLLLEELGLTYYRQMIWKKVGVPVPLWFNTRSNPVARQFTPNYTHEVILIFTNGDLERGGGIEIDELCENDVFEFGQQFATTDLPEGMQRTGAQSNLERRSMKAHPAAFPPRIPAMFMRHLADIGGYVGEPFAGAGSTICAAEKTERRCIAMEIEPKYVAVALERLSEMGLKPELLKKSED